MALQPAFKPPLVMRLFSRNKEAVEAVPVDDVPFESLRRSPRNARKPRAAADSDFGRTAPLDPAEASKTRARRRLIGAIALALAAIVFVPMLFDRAPVAPTDDISLQIPDRDSPFEGRRGVPDMGKGPLRPSAEPPANPSGVAASPAVEAPVADAGPAVHEAVPPAASDKPIESPSGQNVRPPAPATTKSTDKRTAAPVDKQSATSKPASTDDPRALAALEGKPAGAGPTEPAAERSYAVQVAAFSAVDKARGLRDQLVANGLKSYTESVSTAQGLRTRVRLGPFASRDAADRAKQKLKTMKLDGSVVTL